MEKTFSYARMIRSSWDRTLAAWPLLLAQAAFVSATWALIIGGAIAILVPLVLRFRETHPGMRFQDLNSSDFGSFLTPSVVGALILIAGLLLLWVFLIGLFVKGGTYGRLWDQAVQGRFSFKGFMSDGAKNFPGLMGFQCVTLGVGLVVGALLIGLFVLGALLVKGGHGLTVLLAAIAAVGFVLLVIIPLALLVGSYLTLVMAHLTRGQGVWEAFRSGWGTLKASQWRGLKLIGGVLVAMVVGMLVITVGLEVLKLVPIVKWFAMAARVGFNMVFGVLWAVYLPALSIIFVHETVPED